MMTNLFVIANVKQLRTGGSCRILLPFCLTYWGVGVLNSAIFNSFHNRVEFGTILEGLRNFGGVGGLNPPPPNLASVRHCAKLHGTSIRTAVFWTQRVRVLAAPFTYCAPSHRVRAAGTILVPRMALHRPHGNDVSLRNHMEWLPEVLMTLLCNIISSLYTVEVFVILHICVAELSGGKEREASCTG